jgi:hypothetical protein
MPADLTRDTYNRTLMVAIVSSMYLSTGPVPADLTRDHGNRTTHWQSALPLTMHYAVSNDVFPLVSAVPFQGWHWPLPPLSVPSA